MPANSWPDAEASVLVRVSLLHLLREGARYFAASAVALAADALVYVALIRLADVHYLAAAPAGFMLGLAVHYALSTRWVFKARRLSDARAEFLIFALIGVGGLLLNQLVIYLGVERFGLSPELAKLLSAALSFCFNYGVRKVLLFTGRRDLPRGPQ